jgi:hypothetical protein
MILLYFKIIYIINNINQRINKVVKSMNLIDYPIEENEEESLIHRALGIKNFDTSKVKINIRIKKGFK